ncbi:MAG: SUMF1/EgtB/PvdO family nonheme iron enzyme [Flavobacteriales bacterium]|nr:SUMF1/EgtB/PvdO family nonheme iron enzyme [Flavobacteriales bacterium]
MKRYKLHFLVFIILTSCNKGKVDPHVQIPELELEVDRFEVSTGEFQDFVRSVKYITTADSLQWSGVFNIERNEWEPVDQANWEKPDGKNVIDMDRPVTQVSYWDACAYCEWKKGRLPTAEEWDVIAGDVIVLGNVWQGIFPINDLGEDGFKTKVAPIGSFEANAIGVHDLFGNVWEWTSSTDRNGQMIIKGGSFLCDESFCSGYIPEKYQTTPKDSGLNHLGFRCVYDQ